MFYCKNIESGYGCRSCGCCTSTTADLTSSPTYEVTYDRYGTKWVQVTNTEFVAPYIEIHPGKKEWKSWFFHTDKNKVEYKQKDSISLEPMYFQKVSKVATMISRQGRNQ